MEEFLGNLAQLTVNGVINGAMYALLGIGFGLILSVSGRFHIAFTVTYTAAAFVAAYTGLSLGFPLWASAIAGGLLAAVIGVGMEAAIYGPLAKSAARSGNNPLLMIFVASLGLSIIGTNIIAIATLGIPSFRIEGFDDAGFQVGPVTLTRLGVIIFFVGWALTFALQLVLTKTTLGRMVRAVRSNPDMALCVGIDPRTVYLVVFAIGSFIGGIAGVLHATQTSATTSMGLVPFFYALVVAFVSGLNSSPLRIAVVALALGLVETLSALFLPTQLTTLVVFVVLFMYVALRPVRFADVRKRFSAKAAPSAVGG